MTLDCPASGSGDLDLTGPHLLYLGQRYRQDAILVTGPNLIGIDRTMNGQLALKAPEEPFAVTADVLLAHDIGLAFTDDAEHTVVEGNLNVLAADPRQINLNRHRLRILANIEIGSVSTILIHTARDEALQIAAEERSEGRDIAQGGTGSCHKFHVRVLSFAFDGAVGGPSPLPLLKRCQELSEGRE